MSATVQGMMGYGYLGDDTFDSAVAQMCLDAAKQYGLAFGNAVRGV